MNGSTAGGRQAAGFVASDDDCDDVGHDHEHSAEQTRLELLLHPVGRALFVAERECTAQEFPASDEREEGHNDQSGVHPGDPSATVTLTQECAVFPLCKCPSETRFRCPLFSPDAKATPPQAMGWLGRGLVSRSRGATPEAMHPYLAGLD